MGNGAIRSQALGWILMLFGYVFNEQGQPMTGLFILIAALYFFCKSVFEPRMEKPEENFTNE